MAGTVTESRVQETPAPANPLMQRITLAWTSDSAGNATLTTKKVDGILHRVTFNPGSAAPTDDYDVTLSDEDGIDVLAGQGANRDTANSETIVPGVALKDGTTVSVTPIAVCGPLSLSVSNAGASKNGTVVLYVR